MRTGSSKRDVAKEEKGTGLIYLYPEKEIRRSTGHINPVGTFRTQNILFGRDGGASGATETWERGLRIFFCHKKTDHSGASDGIGKILLQPLLHSYRVYPKRPA